MAEAWQCEKCLKHRNICRCERPSVASPAYDRDRIINDMCMTWRHDYGLLVTKADREANWFGCGMTKEEREFLHMRMAQVFDNNVKPILDRQGR